MRGGLKGVPTGARVIPFLNKADTAERLEQAQGTAILLLHEPRVSRVAIGALHAEEPVRQVRRRVSAVVLGAGESRRMGTNKLLLPWGETTVLEKTLRNMGASGVAETLIVTGHERELIEPLTVRYGRVSFNRDYTKGMLSSAQAAVRALGSSTEAMLVMLGDQPLVGPDIIDALLEAYAAGPGGLIAPTYGGRRGNPVIIDRRYFAELLALPPEAAPRALLQRHPDDLLLVEVQNDAILHDLDRPEDYERLRPR